MAKVNLSGMSLKDLEALKTRVEKAISKYEKKEKAKALAAVKAAAKKLGYSLSELTGETGTAPRKTASKKSAKAGQVTHRDPANPENTYGGRGPRPKWLKEALAAGKSLDDFKV